MEFLIWFFFLIYLETSVAINDDNSPQQDLDNGRGSSVKFEEESVKVDDGELARIETEGELNQQCKNFLSNLPKNIQKALYMWEIQSRG